MNHLLIEIAKTLEQQMIQIGGNPRDPQEVEAFINGCGIVKKIKKLVLEELDEE